MKKPSDVRAFCFPACVERRPPLEGGLPSSFRGSRNPSSFAGPSVRAGAQADSEAGQAVDSEPDQEVDRGLVEVGEGVHFQEIEAEHGTLAEPR